MKNTQTIQQRLEESLARLVSMRTISNDITTNKVAIDTLANELQALGMHVQVGGTKHPWLVATTQTTKTPTLAWYAHLDVVPAPDELFSMRTDDTKIYGRGVFDMKFSLACYLELLHDMANSPEGLAAYDISLMISTDEEVSGIYCMGEMLKDGWHPQVILMPDGGRDWKIEAKAKGMTWCSLTATGVSAHSSRPHEGDNALSRLIPALHEVIEKYPNDDPLGLVVGVNVIKGGSQVNQVPDHATADIDVRTFDDQEMHRVRAFLGELAKRHGLELEVHRFGHAVELNQEHPLVQEFFKAYETVMHKPAELTYSLGGTDASLLPSDIPAVILYPRGDEAHSANEWMMREDLPVFFELTKCYTEQVARINSTEKSSALGGVAQPTR